MRISDWSSDVCSSDLDNADEAVVEQVTDRDPVGLGRDLPLELQRRRRRDSRNDCIDKSRQNLESFSRAVEHGLRVDMKVTHDGIYEHGEQRSQIHKTARGHRGVQNGENSGDPVISTKK